MTAVIAKFSVSGIRPGTVLQGGWVVEMPLRAGPTGVAFRCFHDDDPMRRATIKVFVDTYAEGWRRFKREAHVLTRVRHPHLIRADSASLDAEPAYLVLQPWEGPDLRALLANVGALPLAQSLRVARDLANLLAHLHAQAIYHRDLQPENIILTEFGPLVVQMGVSRDEGFGMLTMPGTRLGDLRYAPPEWASEQRKKPQQWDLYALGLTLHAMLTGVEPFSGDASLRESDRVVRLTKRKRATPHLDPGEAFDVPVRTLVRSLTDADPDRRPTTAREVHFALVELLESMGEDPRAPTGPAPAFEEPSNEPPPSIDAPVVDVSPSPPTLVPAMGGGVVQALPTPLPPEPRGWRRRLGTVVSMILLAAGLVTGFAAGAVVAAAIWLLL
ncbi:MAG: protein kinase [Myxococcales bacterium]|nr:protein kinase [Myxococcales bacterium]